MLEVWHPGGLQALMRRRRRTGLQGAAASCGLHLRLRGRVGRRHAPSSPPLLLQAAPALRAGAEPAHPQLVAVHGRFHRALLRRWPQAETIGVPAILQRMCVHTWQQGRVVHHQAP
jgi:hypothetical protein